MKTVEAVKTKDDIRSVEYLFNKHYGELYAGLWRVGVNMALRISDLLAIRYDAIDLTKDKPIYELVEGKTGKSRRVLINGTAKAIIERRWKANPSDIYLFQVHSNRTSSMEPKPISRFTVAKRFNSFKISVDHRNNNQLGDALPNFNSKGCYTTIPTGNKQLPLIIRVNKPRQITQNQPMLMAKSGARQQHRSKPRIGHVNRKAGRHQHRFARYHS